MKALSAGSLAFGVGLISAAAYVGGTLVHENLVFSKEQSTAQTSENTTKAIDNKRNDTPSRTSASASNIEYPGQPLGSSSQSATSADSSNTALPTRTPDVPNTSAPVPTMTDPVSAPTDPIDTAEPEVPSLPAPHDPSLMETVESTLPALPAINLVP